MVSSESGGGNGVVDSRIGTIVWVRRRNGSWWPGKILGMDELSASHLMSPRSGTPVKLLGREDASVDWYNLEKSKRVKTFRCGEFDDCIERAEASLGLPSKKREKYARREDAILHALELEKEILEKKYGKEGANSSIRNNSSAGKDLCTSLGALKNGNGRDESVELKQFQKINVSPSVDECNVKPLSTQRVVGNAWQRSVISESNPLLGSQDYILPKKIVSLASSPLHKETSDDHAQAVSACGDGDSGYSTDKAKGLLDHSIEESNIKRHDRRHPMFQNSTTWPGHSLQLEGDAFSMSVVNNPEEEARVKRRRLLYLHSQFTEVVDIKGDSSSQMENLASHPGVGSHSHADVYAKAATFESSEDTESESDSSETDSMEHYTNVERITYTDVNAPMALQSTTLNSLEMQGDHASREESDESFPHHTPHFYQKNPVSLDMGISRWQMKGKRNDRGFTKRSLDKISYGTYLEPRSSVQRPSHNLSSYNGHDGYSNGVDFIEDDPEPYIVEHGSREHIRKSQSQVASRKLNCAGSSMTNWQELTWRGNAFGGYLGNSLGGFNSYGALHGQELLLDVDLKVQANTRREHVPFVSLMSRLNGKPIIGHPVQIETLEDGSTDAIVSSVDAFEDFESDDENREPPPAWTTSRRTSKFRAPRPHLSSHLDGVNNQHVDQDKKPQIKKSVSGNAHAKKKILARKKSRHVPKVPSSERKNPPKRSNLSSSQKTRPLSSIGMDRKLVSEPRHSSLISYMDGVVKPLDSVPPIVACIPVKLVFSRLLEAIGRPPSMTSSLNKGFSEQQ